MARGGLAVRSLILSFSIIPLITPLAPRDDVSANNFIQSKIIIFKIIIMIIMNDTANETSANCSLLSLLLYTTSQNKYYFKIIKNKEKDIK